MSPWKLVSIWFLLPHAVVVKKKQNKKNKKMKRETVATQSNSFAIYGQIDERYTKMSLFLIDKQSRLVLQSSKLFLIMSRTIDQYI